MNSNTQGAAYSGGFVRIMGFCILLIVSFLLVVPFIYLLISSFKDMGQFYANDWRSLWFPTPLHPENYTRAVTEVALPRYMGNSILLSLVQTLLCLGSSTLVAYGFSRFRFRGRNILFILLLSTIMLPTQVTGIPLFIFFRQIRWTNTFLPLIVPYLFGSPWHIFLIKQFMDTIPREMEEAALMDGASSLKIFQHVILPQSVPALFISALFQFLYSWKDLMGPLIYLSDSRLYTLTIGLLFFESPGDLQYTVQLAAVVLALIPTVIFFIIGRKYYEQGIVVAELK